jgi:hypothetical protein
MNTLILITAFVIVIIMLRRLLSWIKSINDDLYDIKKHLHIPRILRSQEKRREEFFSDIDEMIKKGANKENILSYIDMASVTTDGGAHLGKLKASDFGKYIDFGISQREEEKTNCHNKKETDPNESKYVQLLNKGKYGEAMDFIEELLSKKELREDDADKWAKVCVDGLATTLYAEGIRFFENHQYDEAIDSLKQLRAFILKTPELFGMHRDSFNTLLAEWMEEIQNTTSINSIKMKDLPHLEKKLFKKANNKNEYDLGNLKMFFHALVIPSICESMKKDTELT